MSLPEEHARGGRRVLDESAKVAPHRVVKDVPSLAVKLRDGDGVRVECVVPPGGEHRVHDHLRERRHLHICGRGLVVWESQRQYYRSKEENWMDSTCMSIASSNGEGPDAKPIRIPEDSTFDMLSKRSTRPTSGISRSRAK